MAIIDVNRQFEIAVMRAAGKSYAEIGEKYGITRQAVQQAESIFKIRQEKRNKKIDKIIYQGIYDMFYDDYNFNIHKLVVMMGYSDNSPNCTKIRNFITGNNNTIKMAAINSLIKNSGETYEVLFKRRTPEYQGLNKAG